MAMEIQKEQLKVVRCPTLSLLRCICLGGVLKSLFRGEAFVKAFMEQSASEDRRSHKAELYSHYLRVLQDQRGPGSAIPYPYLCDMHSFYLTLSINLVSISSLKLVYYVS